MTELAKTLMMALLAAFLLSACSDTETLSRGPDGIAIEVDDEDDLDEAADEAEDYCEDSDRQAVLDRTEIVGDAAVAYFDCI